MVIVEEPKEEGGGNALVSIAEGMVLGDEVEQHGSFFFHTRIEFLTSECLVNLPNTAFERIVLLIAKKNRATKLFAQSLNLFHRVFVSGVKGFLLRGFFNGQPLVVVVVECVESIGVICHDLKQGPVLFCGK